MMLCLGLLTRSIRWARRSRLTVLNLFGDRVVKLQLQLQQMMQNSRQMQYQEMLSKRHSKRHRMQSKQTPSKQSQIYRSARKYLVTSYCVAFV